MKNSGIIQKRFKVRRAKRKLFDEVRLCLIDQFQVLFVAVLMIEQVNFMSPPPIPPSSSLFSLPPSNLIALEGVSV